MSQFLETIRINNGIPDNLPLHQHRVDSTLREMGTSFRFQLEDLFSSIKVPDEGTFKWRIGYDRSKIIFSELSEYKQNHLTAFKVIEADPQLDYHLKYLEREVFETLKKSVGEGVEPIICKNGFVTDSTFSNLIFKKDDLWYTPKTYLLNGTRRQLLIRTGQILETTIRREDISSFSEFRLINALNDFESIHCYPTDLIRQ